MAVKCIINMKHFLKMMKELSIRILPPLTLPELKSLAQRQLMQAGELE